MNQILISEKVYVTPEMKRKKVFFKIEFILSVFLLCLLSSYYIYAEYDRNKNEQVSQEILNNLQFYEQEEEIETIIVVLNEAFSNVQEIETEAEITEEDIPDAQVTIGSNGVQYYTIGVIDIPSISVHYPILQTDNIDDIEEVIKTSPCKFWGPDINQVGNLCIVGHNYRNSKFFSKVINLKNGDVIEITDLFGNKVTYKVYDKYEVDPKDTSCTAQETDGKVEITLITCTNDSKKRVIVKARAVE